MAALRIRPVSGVRLARAMHASGSKQSRYPRVQMGATWPRGKQALVLALAAKAVAQPALREIFGGLETRIFVMLWKGGESGWRNQLGLFSLGLSDPRAVFLLPSRIVSSQSALKARFLAFCVHLYIRSTRDESSSWALCFAAGTAVGRGEV
jgi:hypothetical protein